MSPKITVAFIAVVLLTGCSALGRVTALHSETDGWVAHPPIPERSHAAFMRYEFGQEPVTVSTCSLQTRWSIVGLGPPLIPIVPGVLLPFHSFDPSTEADVEDLFFYVQLKSAAGPARIDFSNAVLKANGSREPARIRSIRRYNDNERWPDVCGRLLRDSGETVSGPQEIRNKNVQYLLEFDVPWKTTETFSIDLGSIALGELQIPLPPMTYRRNSYYFYMPFLLPPVGHGEQKPLILYSGGS
jgi:hypothetical protein